MPGALGEGAPAIAADPIQTVLTDPDYLWCTFSALSATDLIAACCVSKQMCTVEHEHEEQLWAALCHKEFEHRSLFADWREPPPHDRAAMKPSRSSRLASLPAKRRYRLLLANWRAHCPKVQQGRACHVLETEYEFEIELNGDGLADAPDKAFCGVVVPQEHVSGAVGLHSEGSAVANSGWAIDGENNVKELMRQTLTLRVFVTRRCDNKLALLMTIPVGELEVHSEGDANIETVRNDTIRRIVSNIHGVGFQSQDERSFLPGSFFGCVENSWRVDFFARASEDAKLSDVDVFFYSKPGGQANSNRDDSLNSDLMGVMSEELELSLKHLEWA